MGFNFYGYGNIHPCGVKDGNVYFRLPSGLVVKYPTGLDVEIPEQTNLFYSTKVMFLLYDDENMYIGRTDNSISIYRRSDELLVGLNNWEPPKYADTKVCGFYNDNGQLLEIHLDVRDNRTVYICSRGLQGLLKEPLDEDFQLNDGWFSALVWGNNKNYHIFNKRGEPVEVDVWTIQDDVRRRNCPVFI